MARERPENGQRTFRERSEILGHQTFRFSSTSIDRPNLIGLSKPKLPTLMLAAQEPPLGYGFLVGPSHPTLIALLCE